MSESYYDPRLGRTVTPLRCPEMKCAWVYLAGADDPSVVEKHLATHEPCCTDGPRGHTQQQHHDASACFDLACPFDHPYGGPFPHPCDVSAPASPPSHGVAT